MRRSDCCALVILATALLGCGVYGPPVRAAQSAEMRAEARAAEDADARAAGGAAEPTAELDAAAGAARETSP